MKSMSFLVKVMVMVAVVMAISMVSFAAPAMAGKYMWMQIGPDAVTGTVMQKICVDTVIMNDATPLKGENVKLVLTRPGITLIGVEKLTLKPYEQKVVRFVAEVPLVRSGWYDLKGYIEYDGKRITAFDSVSLRAKAVME